jgi:hypothetical protein
MDKSRGQRSAPRTRRRSSARARGAPTSTVSASTPPRSARRASTSRSASARTCSRHRPRRTTSRSGASPSRRWSQLRHHASMRPSAAFPTQSSPRHGRRFGRIVHSINVSRENPGSSGPPYSIILAIHNALRRTGAAGSPCSSSQCGISTLRFMRSHTATLGERARVGRPRRRVFGGRDLVPACAPR